jgi:SEC-C motif-containing protein
VKGQNPDCPCGSGQRYSQCCRRWHRGDEPPDAVTLMRSRYAAYALGEVEYLWKTLDPEHPDRLRPQDEVLAGYRAFCRSLRFARLRVLDHSEDHVLFHAELYEKGKERSFAELSRFRFVDGGWRYSDGRLRELAAADPGLGALTLSSF